MSEEMPTIPNDQEPIDDMPTEVHDDWPGGDGNTKPPERILPVEPDEMLSDEVEPVAESAEPVADELEPVEEMMTLEHDDWIDEDEEAGAPSRINPRLVALVLGGGLIVFIGLVLAVLFLPPFYLAATLRGCQSLDADNPSLLRDDGLTASWIGPDSVRLCIGSVSEEDFRDGQGGAQFQGALDALPVYLQLRSPVYTVEKIGDSSASLQITLPPEAQPYTDLDLYRWDSKNKEWVFVPGHVDAVSGLISTDETPDNIALFQAAAITPLMGATLDMGDVFDPNVGSAMNLVLPTGITLGPDNSLSGSVAGGWQLGAGYAVVPVVRSSDPSSLSAMLGSEADVALHISDLKSFVVGDGYNGVAIDYQGLSPADSEAFNKFIADLAKALHEYDKQLVVVLPPPTGGAGVYDTGGYDWRAIGAAADTVIITPGSNPDDYAVNGNVTSLIGWATGEVSRLKIYLSFPTQSAQDVGGTLSLISYDDALNPLGKTALTSQPEEGKDFFSPGADLNFGLDGNVADLTADQNTGAFHYSLAGGQGQTKVWIVTAATVRARLDMASAQHIGGMVLMGLMSPGNDGGLPTVISEFKASQASTVPSGLMIAWTVTGSAGAVLNQTTGLGTPLAWKAGDAGSYKVGAAIVGGKAVDRGEVGVKVAEATTAAPTKKPVLVTAAAGGTAPPAATTAPPAATTQAPPPPVGSANLGGGFELGGQVPGGIGHLSAMQQAGMTWVKYQHKWGPGDDPSSVAGNIAEAHGMGLKVLLSIPGSTAATIDYGAYASFLGGVAALGPDAIEVWNEMNFSREWPPAELGGGNYVTKMLAPAFNAIKSANPNVMVISGAPTPTGAFPQGCGPFAITGEVGCNDYEYIAQMRDAGATNYADCMGVHFNSGATDPSAATGHPNDAGDHHYSWYYQPMVNLYYGTFGKKLCFTELGYASAEGMGAAPGGFPWAGSVSVAQQASYLANTAVMASQSGQVRLIIVWNVDFPGSAGGDPQGMYAIVRPDGSCPACAALGGVMH